jgi:hypothetical protein
MARKDLTQSAFATDMLGANAQVEFSSWKLGEAPAERGRVTDLSRIGPSVASQGHSTKLSVTYHAARPAVQGPPLGTDLGSRQTGHEERAEARGWWGTGADAEGQPHRLAQRPLNQSASSSRDYVNISSRSDSSSSGSRPAQGGRVFTF